MIRPLHRYIITIFILSLIPILPYRDAYGADTAGSSTWKTHLELSYVKTSGNTDTQTFSGSAEIKKEGEVNRYFINGNFLQAESDNRETSNKLSLDLRWERVFSDRVFGFLTSGYLRDRFSGFDYRLYVGPGIGYYLLKGEKRSLQGLLSFLYYHDEFSKGEAGSDDYITGKATLKYQWRIRDNLLLKEDVNYFVSIKETDRSFFDSTTALEVKINRAISLGVKYVINYQSEPPSSDVRHTDTTFLTSLIIDL